MTDTAVPVSEPSGSASDGMKAEVGGHRLELIFDGERRLERLLTLIDGAIRSIDLIMYIFEHDGAGTRVLDAMTAAARRGVRVRAVIDSFGSGDVADSVFNPLREAGGTVTFFSRRWRSSYLVRNHQKLILIDGNVAVTGGFNIADDYLSKPRADCWFDLGLIVAGPTVDRAVQWFDIIHDYTIHDDGKLLMLRRLVREWRVGTGSVQWLVGGPTDRLSPWARAVRADLDRGRRLDMVMAYFSPGQGMLRRLGRLARRCPDIELRLKASTQPVDFDHDEVDLAVRVGRGGVAGALAIPLFGESVAPLASPAFIRQHGIRRASDLARVPLLHDDSLRRAGRPPGWSEWCRVAKLRGIDTDRGVHFDDGHLVLQAAAAGRGVALGRLAYALDDLDARRLRMPFGPVLKTQASYYLLVPEGPAQEPAIATLRAWFEKESLAFAPKLGALGDVGSGGSVAAR
jgi:DNA-binding transcriptional LysR family regulator